MIAARSWNGTGICRAIPRSMVSLRADTGRYVQTYFTICASMHQDHLIWRLKISEARDKCNTVSAFTFANQAFCHLSITLYTIRR